MLVKVQGGLGCFWKEAVLLLCIAALLWWGWVAYGKWSTSLLAQIAKPRCHKCKLC